MSNCYIQTAFTFILTAPEAILLRAAIAACDFAMEERQADDTATFWADLPQTFRDLFPPINDDLLSGFIAIFSDPQWPCLDTNFTFSEKEEGHVVVFGSSDQFSSDAVAAVLEKVVTTSLPIIITYAMHDDKYRPDAFGGGGFIIGKTGTNWVHTSDLHDLAKFSPRLVIQTNTPEGSLFWNETNGFGDLESATTFTEEEAGKYNLPIANDQPEWVQLPKQAA